MCAPPSENPNVPSAFIVFLTMITRVWFSVVVALPHSVEYVGIGQPIPLNSTHLMNGPMSEVPPPVIAAAIAAPSPCVEVPLVVEAAASTTFCTEPALGVRFKRSDAVGIVVDPSVGTLGV